MKVRKGFLYTLIEKRFVVIALIIILFILGGINFAVLPKQEYPIIQLPIVLITTVYPGASAADIEELVTSKIEDKCMEAEGFDSVKSESYNGISVVRMMFSRDLNEEKLQDNMDKLRNEITALKDNELPSGVTSLVYNDNAFETCGYIAAFTSKTETNEELVQRAEALKDELIGMNGVSKVEIEGEIERQIKIKVNADKLNYSSISLSELAQMVNYQNSTIPAGTIEFEDNELYINSSGKLESIDEINNIIVGVDSETGAVTKLRDIAEVSMEDNEDSKAYFYNGNQAVILSVYFSTDVNVLATGKNVLARIDDYKKNISELVNIDDVIYLPNDVSKSIYDFVINLIESVAIVLVVIMIGMSIINGSIVAVAIPLTIFITFTAMKLFKIDIQFVSLASLIIALGMLVDNAIVVSDAIQVMYDSGEDKLDACVKGAESVALPVLASTLTTVIIFGVFYMLPGTMKRFVFSLPTIVISALMASYVISMTVTPVICYMLMRKSKQPKLKKQRLRGFFTALLRLGMEHKAITLIVSFAAVGISVLLMMHMDLELVPYSDKMLLDVDITTDNLYDIRKTKSALKAAEGAISREAGVEYYLSCAGGRVPKYDFTSMPGTDSTNNASMIVKINLDESGFKDKSDYCEYLEAILAEKVAGSRVIVKEVGIIPKPSEPVQLNICGSDFDILNQAALEAENWLKTADGSRNVYSNRKLETYNYYVDMKNDELNSSGLTKGEVQNELNIAMMGRTASIFRKNNKEYPIVLKTDIRNAVQLKEFKVKSSITGSKYKLSQVSDITLNKEYSSISRYNGKRSVSVTAGTKGGKSPVELQMALQKELNKRGYRDISIAYEGDEDMLNDILSSLLMGAALGVIGIIFILYVQFNSIKRSLIILTTIPFALIGSSLGLTIFGENLSMFAILGIISLIGVVVNNAIVLIDYMDGELKGGRDVNEACLTAVDKRLRPILLSSSTSILGLVPLIISGNVLFRGLSIAFMFGLATSLFFTLIVIPVIYSIIIKRQVNG